MKKKEERRRCSKTEDEGEREDRSVSEEVSEKKKGVRECGRGCQEEGVKEEV